MKAITFIRMSKSGGGAENYLNRVIKALKAKNIECKKIHSEIPKFIPSYIRVLLFNLQVCITKKDQFYFSLERISCPDIYRAGDGVHKVFLKNKGFTLNPLHILYLILEKKSFNNAKRIIANSNMVKREIIDTYNIMEEKIAVIYNGIFLKEDVDASSLKKEFNISNEKIILFVGSGFKRKGVKEFLEIIAKIKTPYKAFIVGKEKKIKKYIKYANKLGLSQKVIFTGPRHDVDKFYSLANIFILPTQYDPFANVILEAMNFGCIPFTTKRNGASEILPKEWIIDNNISSKIEILLKNSEKLKMERCRAENIVKNFSIEKNLEQTLEIIKDLINEK